MATTKIWAIKDSISRVVKYAKNLYQYASEIEDEYSIPIINKRIAVTPISLIGESCKEYDYVYLAKKQFGGENDE